MIRFYRTLAKLCEKVLGFDNKYSFLFRNKVCDQIDYLYGPSDSAEKSAQRTGYWNLETAKMFLDRIYPYQKDDVKKEIIRPMVYRFYQVRKY